MKKYIPVILFLLLPAFLFSQTQYQHWQWAKSFGGGGNDKTVDMKIKNGFLYVTGTFTSPQINWDGTILNNHGGQDIFVAKMDTIGNTVWVKSFGGNGDDDVHQLEINSNSTMVLRCQSSSTSLLVESFTLTSPENFYAEINTNGNILQAVKLPVAASYQDIDISLDDAVYVSAQYQLPFVFGSSLIDTTYGFAGAALLKYNNNGNAEWYKNIQVRSNPRYEIFNWNWSPFDSSSGPPSSFTQPITGDATAQMAIEFNEHDTVIGMIATYRLFAFFESPYRLTDHYNNATLAFQLKINPAGVESNGNFYSGFATYAGTQVYDFKTGPLGHSYTASGYHNLGGEFHYELTKERNNAREKTKEWFYYSPYREDIPATAWAPIEPSETGEYALCADVAANYWPGQSANNNAVILDSNLNVLKKTQVAEINRLSLNIKCMSDTNAIFFGSNFSDSSILMNVNYPRASFTLANNGGQEIFIGKYAFGICRNTTVVQNVQVCNGTSYTFPDNTVLGDITTDTSYTCTIQSTFGCDSTITTNISLIYIDTAVIKNNLSLTANASPALYQWLDCIAGATISSANSQTYTASSIGSYAVEITKDGCIDTSSCYVISAADILAGGRPIAAVYPVPANDNFTLVVQSEKIETASIALLDFTGNVVKQQTTLLSFGKNTIQQNISSLAAGRYTLVIRKTSAGETITKTIIKL